MRRLRSEYFRQLRHAARPQIVSARISSNPLPTPPLRRFPAYAAASSPRRRKAKPNPDSIPVLSGAPTVATTPISVNSRGRRRNCSSAASVRLLIEDMLPTKLSTGEKPQAIQDDARLLVCPTPLDRSDNDRLRSMTKLPRPLDCGEIPLGGFSTGCLAISARSANCLSRLIVRDWALALHGRQSGRRASHDQLGSM